MGVNTKCLIGEFLVIYTTEIKYIFFRRTENLILVEYQIGISCKFVGSGIASHKQKHRTQGGACMVACEPCFLRLETIKMFVNPRKCVFSKKLFSLSVCGSENLQWVFLWDKTEPTSNKTRKNITKKP